MIEIHIRIPELSEDQDSEVSLDSLSDSILKSAALELYRVDALSKDQAAQIAKLPLKGFLMLAGETSLQPPDSVDSLSGSRYLARVLWALFEGERQAVTPMTAAEIAKFVTSASPIKIESTNTARFFRDCRESGEFEDCWLVSEEEGRRRYSISEKGKQLLLAQSDEH